MAVDFFATTGELRDYVQGIDAAVQVESFDPYMRPARRKIYNLIGASTYTNLKTYYESEYPGGDDKKDTAIKYIQGAMANLMAISYFIFNAPGPNDEKRMYRYQEEKRHNMLLENAWTEMDSLINHLENNTTTFSAYTNTDLYKDRQDLFIKSATEFHRYYPINYSGYFFNNIVYLIKEVQMEVETRYTNFPESMDGVEDAVKWIIGKALAYETMARACIRLDYTELPRGIRNDIMNEANKAKSSTGRKFVGIGSTKERLSTHFHNEAEKWFDKLEFSANKERNEGDYVPPSSEDDEGLSDDDKFYMPL
jgi:hypothetical protein